MNDKICVIIPSYNEARTIGGIIRGLKEKGLFVCVVDDGSVDGTSSIAEREGAHIIRHEKNKGKGASLRSGFEYVLGEPFSMVLVMDGDGQHMIEDVDNFLNKESKTGADIVIGNRMSNACSMPLTRRLTNKFMSSIISKICGHRIPDTQCGFRLIKRGVLESISLDSSNYEIESELLFKAARKGFKIESAPVATVYAGEESRINPFVDTIRFITLLIRTLARR